MNHARVRSPHGNPAERVLIELRELENPEA